MTTTFCNSGHVKTKAGANVSSALTTQYDDLINEAECRANLIVADKAIDLVNQFSTLETNVKLILQDYASSYAAFHAVKYDPSGYTNLAEAQTIMLGNWQAAQDIEKDLRISDKIKFLRSSIS